MQRMLTIYNRAVYASQWVAAWLNVGLCMVGDWCRQNPEPALAVLALIGVLILNVLVLR